MQRVRYVDQVIESWEDGYKKGLLTFWILMALDDRPRHVRDVYAFMTKEVATGLTPDEKSIYRSLGKFKKMELVTAVDLPSSNGGPAYKLYSLTDTGRQVLKGFIDRNISPIFLTTSFNQRIKGVRSK